MLVSRDWLKEYVALPDHDELVDRLTMSGLNHEGSEMVGDDQQIDLEVTSNRSDCLGHIGVAREVAVLFENPLKIPDPQPATEGSDISQVFDVQIDCPALCYRFTARLIRGVKVGPSPDWLVERLQTVGIASVNNVVDLSNYVMLECGQPLHTFDYDQLNGNKIVVREPAEKESLVAIDHNTYALQPGMCVIADGERAVGLGGVMGGTETEVTDSTCNILVEAAFFNPMCIRATARKLKLHSPASYRFERSINSENIDWASRRCCEMIMQLAGGQLAEGMIDVGQAPATRPPIDFRFHQLQRILGIAIPRETAVSILENLGFGVAPGTQDPQDSLSVSPPAWRLDVNREIDLIEEVGRIYGYDKVPDDVAVPMAASVRSHEDRVMQKIRHAITAAGFDEAMTASLVPEAWSDCFTAWSNHPPLQSHQAMLGVLDTSWQNMPVNLLRRSLLPSLLEAFRINEYKQNDQVELFETARVYLANAAGLPTEPIKLGLVSERSYGEIKGVVEAVVGMLNTEVVVETDDCDLELLDITHASELLIDGQRLGWVGKISPATQELFRLKRDATVAELDVGLLNQIATRVTLHGQISPFPALTRDFNFIVDEAVRWGDLAKSVREASPDLLESVRYKETFRNAAKDGADKKRVLLSVVLRSADATLTGEQAELACQAIVSRCKDQQGADLLG
ncbi:MAG: phenylalanine--tRNA ligase subunit beta [Pirellulaceae bacterium]|nr:phenylalanine--tRNA ligase subunit beta [Pirellulaceae bacterium]